MRGRLAAVLFLAAVARLALLWQAPIRLDQDPDRYIELAQAVARGEGLTLPGDRATAYRPPLYPLLLAPLMRLPSALQAPAIGGLHLALGVLACGLTWATARRWGLSERSCLAAAAIVAVDPVLASQVRVVMTETLAAALVALALWAMAARRADRGALLSGLFLGLCGLCRPSLLAGGGLCIVAQGCRAGVPPGQRLRLAAVTAGMIVLIMGPWAARNRRVFGETVWTTTHGGYTLYLANNPVYYDDVLRGPPGAVWEGPRQEAWFASIGPLMGGRLEPRADAMLRAAAWRTIRERPGDFLQASLARLGRLWGVAPSAGVYGQSVRLLTAAWTVPLWVALVLGLRRIQTWRWPGITALLFLVAITAVHVVFWTDLRMRAPVVPAIALIAASAWPGRRSPCSEFS